MTRTVHIVDYGIGNLFSVSSAIEKAGGEPRVTRDPEEIALAERLILPGVGAFRDGMAGLRDAGLVEAITRFAQTERPLLGICLGMQLLATLGTEFGTHEGLNILPGKIEAIPAFASDGTPNKVPFIGWADLVPVRAAGFSGTILNGMGRDDAVYLVHSYQFNPLNLSDALAIYNYGSTPIIAAVARDNIIGCQFHPEKSGPVGLSILRRFLLD
jgi:glutamine amidotransferase